MGKRSRHTVPGMNSAAKGMQLIGRKLGGGSGFWVVVGLVNKVFNKVEGNGDGGIKVKGG